MRALAEINICNHRKIWSSRIVMEPPQHAPSWTDKQLACRKAALVMVNLWPKTYQVQKCSRVQSVHIQVWPFFWPLEATKPRTTPALNHCDLE